MCIKQEDWAMTTSVCSTVLQREPDNFKALFRRGLALSKSGEYADAKKDLLAASKSQPLLALQQWTGQGLSTQPPPSPP